MPAFLRALAIMLLLFLGGQASAQWGGGSTRRGGMGDGDRARAGSPAMRRDEAPFAGAYDQVRMQLNSVRTALKVTPEQATAWQTYEDRVVALLDDLSRGATQPPGGNALKQIESRVDVVRNRLTAMEDIAEAAGTLYAALSDEQRAIADRVLAGTLPALYSGGRSGRGDFGRAEDERGKPAR